MGKEMIAMEQPVINIGIMGVGNIGTGVGISLARKRLLASVANALNLKTVVDTDWERERELVCRCRWAPM